MFSSSSPTVTRIYRGNESFVFVRRFTRKLTGNTPAVCGDRWTNLPHGQLRMRLTISSSVMVLGFFAGQLHGCR